MRHLLYFRSVRLDVLSCVALSFAIVVMFGILCMCHMYVLSYAISKIFIFSKEMRIMHQYVFFFSVFVYIVFSL